MYGKSIFASKTFWFNILSGAATLVGTAAEIMPPQYAPYAAAAIAVINLGLRVVTDQPVHFSK